MILHAYFLLCAQGLSTGRVQKIIWMLEIELESSTLEGNILTYYTISPAPRIYNNKILEVYYKSIYK